RTLTSRPAVSVVPPPTVAATVGLAVTVAFETPTVKPPTRSPSPLDVAARVETAPMYTSLPTSALLDEPSRAVTVGVTLTSGTAPAGGRGAGGGGGRGRGGGAARRGGNVEVARRANELDGRVRPARAGGGLVLDPGEDGRLGRGGRLRDADGDAADGDAGRQ